MMLRYQCEGSGDPLLLIHGWGVTYTIWQSLAPLLKPHFQLIMIELPGIGGSPDVDPQEPYYPACAEAIEEVRQALNIQRWSILAYSSGTRAAESYVQRYPQYCSHAIFLCPIYLTEWCSLGLRLLDSLLDNAHPPLMLTHWMLSDWRLYGLLLALAFNGRPHHYTHTWREEIEHQPVDSLMRMLCELPGLGRAPFELPAVSTLFIWGSRDALTARPRHLRPNDVVIPANHSAPMLAAAKVAEVVIPFLKEGKIVSTYNRWRRWHHRLNNDLGKAYKRAQLLTLLRSTSLKRFSLRKQSGEMSHRSKRG